MTDPIARLNAALEGRYRIEGELGSGGMATVYLAEDLRHHRKVAIKVLKPELAAIVGADRFLAEIETTANLQHPHILPLFDSGDADGFLFFVMPFVAGETLRDKLDRERQLTVEEAIGIATKVASALGYAHQNGVVHRDIKPGNVLLSEIGEPVVADFGIALAVAHAGGGRVTETGLSLGTPHYMSPEQATGDREIGPRSDVYALGCILYEMLTGEPPFTGTSAQAILGRIITGDAPHPTQVRATIPANVDATIRKALEKLPADRFPSAHEFAKALADKDFRHGELAGPGAFAGPGVWRPLSIAASGLALVLAAALGRMMLRPPPPQPVTRWEVGLPEGVTPDNSSGVNLALSPDGTRYVFVGVSADGESQLWLRPLEQLEPVPMRATEDARNPRFSPDGEEVAFIAGGEGSLVIAPVSGAPPRTVVSDSVQAAGGGLAWGSDGMLYFRKAGSGIWRVSANGGQPEEVTTDGEWPEALPDGRGLLLTLDYGSPTQDSIAVLSLETGEVETLLQAAMARYSASGHLVYASGEGTLLAAPFDLDRLELDGPSRPLVEGIQVNGGSASQFTVSASGALAYRPGVAGTAYYPVWIGQDGSQTPLDARLTGQYEAPGMSPDGGRIAFEHTPVGGVEDIWVYTIAQGTLDRLTFGEGSARRPFWSPDGAEIGFISDRDGEEAVYALAADGSESTARLVVQLPDRPVLEALWTPDGRRMVFREGDISAGNDTDLYVGAPDPDSAATVLLDTPFAVFAPALSPDGRWLAYTSDESGQREVYVRPFPGPGGRDLVSDGGGEEPVWEADGRGIFYTRLDGTLVVTTVRTEPVFQVVSREAHPEWPGAVSPTTTQNVDISPLDGRILVLQRSGIVSDARDVVVQNFFEVLRGVFPE